METAFWVAVGFVAYTYVCYPALVWLGARFRHTEPSPTLTDADLPPVRVIIAVHNEERRVGGKIANLLSQDYPRDRLRVLFVCDGCTDHTEAILRAAPEIDVLVCPVRRGKPSALNAAVAGIGEPVIVFADVRQELAAGAIRALVERLQAKGIGAVSGELVHRASGSIQAGHIGLYWRYEKAIRKNESRLYSTVGATGALYAIRRKDFAAIREDTLVDDVEIPLRVVRAGMRIVLEERAIIWDDAEGHVEGEFRRKVRTLAGNVQLIARNGWLLVPWVCPITFQFVSHKIFRLLVPYALVVAFIAAWGTGGTFYRSLAIVQSAGYLVAGLGTVSARLRSLPIVSFLVVFVQLNAAAVVALLDYIRGAASVQWSKST